MERMVLQFDCTGRAQADHDESAGCALIREYDASAAYRSAACAASTAPRTASAYPSASDASDASASDASARDAPQRPWLPVVIRMLTSKKKTPRPTCTCKPALGLVIFPVRRPFIICYYLSPTRGPQSLDCTGGRAGPTFAQWRQAPRWPYGPLWALMPILPSICLRWTAPI